MDVKQELRHYIVEHMLFGDGDRLSETTSFQESGVIDSTGFLEIVAFIEEKFGVAVADGDLVPEDFDTLDKMAAFVQRNLHKVKA
jgi:acyl carrier protein